MMSLMVGSLTVLAYFAILRSSLSGPFYCLMPLPLLVYWYQRDCVHRYMGPSLQMSLKRSVDIDGEYQRYCAIKSQAPAQPTEVPAQPSAKSNLGAAEGRDRRESQRFKAVLDEQVGTIEHEAAPVLAQTTVEDFYMDDEIPIESFRENLFVQPSLIEGISIPMPYRRVNNISTQKTLVGPMSVEATAHADRPSDTPEPKRKAAAHTADASKPRPSMGLKSTAEIYDTTEEFFGQEEEAMDDNFEEPVGVEEDFTSAGQWAATAQGDDFSFNSAGNSV